MEIMVNEEKSLDVQKQELTTADDTERTRECACYVPRADIYELDDDIILLAEMPGVGSKSFDITLEKNVLTINGYGNIETPEGYSLVLQEYEQGDFQRSFTLSDEIDRDKIEASVKNGVLRLRLPKAGPAKTKKITVKAG